MRENNCRRDLKQFSVESLKKNMDSPDQKIMKECTKIKRSQQSELGKAIMKEI